LEGKIEKQQNPYAAGTIAYTPGQGWDKNDGLRIRSFLPPVLGISNG